MICDDCDYGKILADLRTYKESIDSCNRILERTLAENGRLERALKDILFNTFGDEEEADRELKKIKAGGKGGL